MPSERSVKAVLSLVVCSTKATLDERCSVGSDDERMETNTINYARLRIYRSVEKGADTKVGRPGCKHHLKPKKSPALQVGAARVLVSEQL